MAGEIKVNLLSGFEDKGVKDAMDALKRLGAGFKNITKQLLGAYVGFQGLQKGVAFIKDSIDASRDLQRNLAGLETIFGDSTSKMVAFSEASVALGMSTAEAAKATTFIGSVMKQSGFAMDENIVFTQKLVSLGADLAATYGYDVQEALTGMTALFRGEYDPIEKFGVAIKQAQVKAVLAAEGIANLTGQELLHATQLVRMKLLLEATADAQGAVTRQGNTLAVSQARLAAGFKNMQASLGNTLIGPVTALVQLLAKLTEVIGPPLQDMFAVIGTAFSSAGGNAANFANNIAGIIRQLTVLLQIALPIFNGLLTLLSSTLSPLVAMVITFKTLKSVVTGVSVVVGAYNAVMTLLAARTAAAAVAQGAVAGATAAAGAAAAAATPPTVALGVATMLTPWGAIAIAIGLVAAAIVGIAVVAANAKPAVGELGRTAGVVGTNMANIDGTMAATSAGVGVLTGNMSNLGTAIAGVAKAQTTLNGVMPDYGNARAALRADDKKSAKNKSTPELDTINALLAGIKGGTGALGTAAGKAAKAMADPFKTMVKSIQDDMKKVQDSIVGAFDITNMGTKGSSISRNIDKFMKKLREFSGYIKTLREKGLSGDLLQQLAMAGPEKGLAAAKAFAGDQNLINQANAAYGELGTTATAIAGNVVQAKAAPVYNINVNAGVGDKKTIGMAVVEAIKSFERTNGKGWRS